MNKLNVNVDRLRYLSELASKYSKTGNSVEACLEFAEIASVISHVIDAVDGLETGLDSSRYDNIVDGLEEVSIKRWHWMFAQNLEYNAMHALNLIANGIFSGMSK